MMFEAIYKEAFPFWEKISDSDRQYICQNSSYVKYPKGSFLYNSSIGNSKKEG